MRKWDLDWCDKGKKQSGEVSKVLEWEPALLPLQGNMKLSRGESQAFSEPVSLSLL